MNDPVLEIDGASHSGSGAIVRHAVAYAALTGRAIRVVNARAHRRPPGLRHQHLRVIEALAELVDGTLEGAELGSREFAFRPGGRTRASRFVWDVGTAGSATNLALGLLPVLACQDHPVEAEVRGGLFQDFAPSVFHLQHVMVPVLARMGLAAEVEMIRPGYVPRGGGVLRLSVTPVGTALTPLVRDRAGAVQRIWGIALSSHLEERHVSERMATAARQVLTAAGYDVAIEIREDATALQAGAALALFADLEGAIRLGADRAGAPRRRAESIGVRAANQLLHEIELGATLDRFAADQIIPFAAIADGPTTVRIPWITEHVETGAWLAELFLGASTRVEGRTMTIHGVPLHDGQDR